MFAPQIVVPAFDEEAKSADVPAEDDYADEDSLEDLGSAAGLAAARAVSSVALGEPLWTKLQVGDMALSSPSAVTHLSHKDVVGVAPKSPAPVADAPEDSTEFPAVRLQSLLLVS